MPPQIILDHGVYWHTILEEFHYLCHLCQLHTLSCAAEKVMARVGKIHNEAFIFQNGCEGLWQPPAKHCLAPFVKCCLSYLNRTKCNRFTFNNKMFEESNKKMCLWNNQSHLSYCGIAADYGCCTTAHASHIHVGSFPNSGRKKTQHIWKVTKLVKFRF